MIALTQIADSFVYLNRREMLISVKEPCITLADLSHCGGIPTPRPSEQVFLIKLSDAQHMKKNNLQLLWSVEPNFANNWQTFWIGSVSVASQEIQRRAQIKLNWDRKVLVTLTGRLPIHSRTLFTVILSSISYSLLSSLWHFKSARLERRHTYFSRSTSFWIRFRRYRVRFDLNINYC